MRLVLPCLPLLFTACVVVVDEEPAPPSHIAAASYAFGECWGYCGHDVELDGERVKATHIAWGDASPPPPIVNQGVLSDDAVDELRVLAADLADADLAETYGCPDCGDGGSSALVLVVGDVEEQTIWEHNAPPPGVLADAQAILLDDIAVALGRCEATARVTPTACSPLP